MDNIFYIRKKKVIQNHDFWVNYASEISLMHEICTRVLFYISKTLLTLQITFNVQIFEAVEWKQS